MAHKRAKRSIREANRAKDGTDRAPSGNGNESPADFEKLPKNAMRVLMSAQVREDYRKRKREEQEGTNSKPGEGGKKKGKISTSTTPSTSSSSSKLTILPGESLLHFNRRVEDSLRSSVSASTKTAHAHTTDIARLEREERTKKHEDRVATQQAAKAAKESGKSGMQGDSKPDATAPSSKKAAAKPVPLTPAEQKEKKNSALLQNFIPAASSSAPKRLNLNDVGSAPPSLTLPRFASKAIKNNSAKAAGEAGGTAGAAAARMGLSLAQQRILEEERERVILRYRELKERKGLGFGGGALVEE